jgi:hypothetical protein
MYFLYMEIENNRKHCRIQHQTHRVLYVLRVCHPPRRSSNMVEALTEMAMVDRGFHGGMKRRRAIAMTPINPTVQGCYASDRCTPAVFPDLSVKN